MDRIVPRLCRVCRPLAILLAISATVPGPTTHAALPYLSGESGDPGDGVLRTGGHEAPTALIPSDRLDAGVVTVTPPSAPAGPAAAGGSALVLVPVLPSPGQPWLLTFRVLRFEPNATSGDSGAGAARSRDGRWRRAF